MSEEKKMFTVTGCVFEGDPPAPHSNWVSYLKEMLGDRRMERLYVRSVDTVYLFRTRTTTISLNAHRRGWAGLWDALLDAIGVRENIGAYRTHVLTVELKSYGDVDIVSAGVMPLGDER